MQDTEIATRTHTSVLFDVLDACVIIVISVIISAVFALVAPISEKDPWEEKEAENE